MISLRLLRKRPVKIAVSVFLMVQIAFPNASIMSHVLGNVLSAGSASAHDYTGGQCDARSKGYYKNNDGCHNGTGESEWASDIQSLSSVHFSGFYGSIGGGQICSELATVCGGNTAESWLCKANQFLLADESNVASGRLQLDALVAGADDGDDAFDRLGLSSASTIGEAIAAIEAVMVDSEHTLQDLQDAAHVGERLYAYYEDEHDNAPYCEFPDDDDEDPVQCDNPVVIDFNEFDAGTIIDDEFAAQGITITVSNNNGPHEAIIYDSSDEFGADPDLGTPNEAYGGPGVGSGPNAGQGNTEALGNLLVIAENIIDSNNDDLVDNPNDEGSGGYINFYFDNPVKWDSLTFVDIEETGGYVQAFLDGSEVYQTGIPGYGDNSVQTVLGSAGEIDRLKIKFTASGGLDDLQFCETETDEIWATIHGYKWLDENGNGEWDSEEQPLQGVIMTATHVASHTQYTATSDSDGDYWIENITKPGAYTVCESVPFGFIQTYPLNDNENCHSVEVSESITYETYNFGNDYAPYCGDGSIDDGEVCDDGDLNGQPNQCNAECTGITTPYCGNSIVEHGEQCDDGNDVNDDGCSNECSIPDVPDPEGDICGVKFNDKNRDGDQDDGEENLSGWTINLYKELPHTQDVHYDCVEKESHSGGIFELALNWFGNDEECEPTEKPPVYELLATQVTNENGYCFEGLAPDDYLVKEVQQEGWDAIVSECETTVVDGEIVDCDFANAETPSGPRCGNEVVEAGEQCDDGNTENGDGCSEYCEIETGSILACKYQDLDNSGTISDADQLLSGWTITLGDGANLIQNYSFETPLVTHASQWDIFDSGTPDLAWSVEWDTSTEVYNQHPIPEVAKLELHSGVNGWLPQHGNQYAELDSDWDGPDGSLNGEPASVKIYQDIPTVPGNEYTISFYHSARPGTPTLDNVLNVYWGDSLLTDPAVSGDGSALSNTNWTQYTLTATATENTTRVSFVDSGTANSLGDFLDNISVTGSTTEQVTDETGCTLFDELAFGTYTVSEVLQNGWIQVLPESGQFEVTLTPENPDATVNFLNKPEPPTGGGSYCGDGVKQVPNSQGQEEECDGTDGITEGYQCTAQCTLEEIVVETASICGVKFNDLNENGTQEDGEDNLSGWTINLYRELPVTQDIKNTCIESAAQGGLSNQLVNFALNIAQNNEQDCEQPRPPAYELVDTVVTTEEGYCFTDLPLDVYTVEEVEQEGWTAVVNSCDLNLSVADEQYTCNVANIQTPVAEVGEYALAKNRVGSGSLFEGDTVVFELIFSNVGTVAINSATLTDTYDTDILTYVSSTQTTTATSTGSIMWDQIPDGSLEPGEDWTITVTFTVNEETSPTSTINFVDATGVVDANANALADNQSQAEVPIESEVVTTGCQSNCGGGGGGGGGGPLPYNPLLVIEKVADKAIVEPSDIVKYTVSIKNVANLVGNDLQVTDTLPAGFTYVDGGGTTKTWDLPPIGPGSTQTVSYDVRVGDDVASGNYVNVAVARISNGQAVQDDATVEVLSPVVLGEEFPEFTELPDTGGGFAAPILLALTVLFGMIGVIGLALGLRNNNVVK